MSTRPSPISRQRLSSRAYCSQTFTDSIFELVHLIVGSQFSQLKPKKMHQNSAIERMRCFNAQFHCECRGMRVSGSVAAQGFVRFHINLILSVIS